MQNKARSMNHTMMETKTTTAQELTLTNKTKMKDITLALNEPYLLATVTGFSLASNPSLLNLKQIRVLLLWNVSKSKLGGVSLPTPWWVKQATFSGWSNHTLPAAMHHSGEGPWKIMCFNPFSGALCTDHKYLLTMVSTQVPS